MNLTPEETKTIKETILYLVERQAEQSGGHNGFTLFDLQPIIDEMVEEGCIEKRNTINSKTYFKK